MLAHFLHLFSKADDVTGNGDNHPSGTSRICNGNEQWNPKADMPVFMEATITRLWEPEHRKSGLLGVGKSHVYSGLN